MTRFVFSLLLLALTSKSTSGFVSQGGGESSRTMSAVTVDEDVVSSSGSSSEEEVSKKAIPYSRTATIKGERCEAGGTLLSESEMLEQQNFPISPEALVEKARHALKKDSGVLDPSLWDDDFEFVAPIIGPLGKEEFLNAANGFQVYEAFPDFDNRYFGFTVDPLEPGRVWFFTRLIATNTGNLFGSKPTNKTVELPPQVFSFKFHESGKIQELTVGYAVDRRQGDTGGLGGMFGLFYANGKGLPFPEGKPYKPSLRFRLINKIGSMIQKFQKKKQLDQ